MEGSADSGPGRAALFFRGRRRKLLPWAAILLVIYVGSHLALSRFSAWRLREALGTDEAGVGCFLYVPCRLETLRDHRSLFGLHLALVFFYAPLWAVDHHLLGGPSPMTSEPTWGLSPAAADDL